MIWDEEEWLPVGLNPKCQHDWINDPVSGEKSGKPGPNSCVGLQYGDAVRRRKPTNTCGRCGAWRGQLGLEPTIDLYLKHLLQCFDEIWRVLKPTGTLWVNIGDSYSGSGCGTNDYRTEASKSIQGIGKNINLYKTGGIAQKIKDIPAKSLCLIPERFAIEMVNRGWILRNKIIWAKPNCMPASVKDRFTVDFEPVFFFTKSNDTQYWTNEKTMKLVSKQPLGTRGVEGEDWEWRKVGVFEGSNSFNVRVRDSEKPKFLQGATEEEKQNYGKGRTKKISLWTGHDYWFEQQYENYDKPLDRWGGDSKKLTDNLKGNEYLPAHRERDMRPNPQGRNRRCVWTISTQPYSEAHFATFPEALIEPMIKAGCPKEVCVKCGKGREKIIKTEFPVERDNKRNKTPRIDGGKSMPEVPEKGWQSIKTEIGLTDCGCNGGFRPGIVLDNFCGSGTVMAVAEKLNQVGIGFDLAYQDLQEKRMKNIQKCLI